ncbi:hypothetical protein E8E15_000051, partial [Penicillium rubens]
RPRRQHTIGDEVVPAPLQVVIVLTNSQHVTEAFAQECAQLQKLDTGTVTILDLRPRHGLSDSVVFQPLQTLIVKQLNIVQAERISNCRRFSASHLSAFWSTGVQSHERLLHAPPFDLLERARRDYVRNKTMDDCLREVMQTCIGYPKEDFDDLVASAFLMDAYPPQMHGFSPTVVFAALYEKRCLSIWDNEFKYHIAGVSSRFVHHFVQLSAVKTSAAIRKETLCRLYRQWGGLRSTTTCLVCLSRPPEHMLPCKHAICDTCVVIFGKSSRLRDYHFEIAQCPICEERSDVTVRQLPPTKPPVILTLDGGGVRGLIQLGLLRALESRIGIPIASLPDLCIGTSVDDFENGCRILAEKARVQVYLPDYRLAPEWAYPVQLNEYEFVLDWLRGEGGKERAVDVNSIFGAGDSAGGNMSASLCLRLKSKRKEPLAGLLLLYPEPRLPFDTPAATDSNSGPYLECNGIFSFAHNYIPNGVSPSHPEITPGAQHVNALRDFPPTAIHTCGFDCLRDVGVEFASNLEKAGNRVFWRHHETLCHGFLQMAPWSTVAMKALEQGADDVRTMLGSYGYEGNKTD